MLDLGGHGLKMTTSVVGINGAKKSWIQFWEIFPIFIAQLSPSQAKPSQAESSQAGLNSTIFGQLVGWLFVHSSSSHFFPANQARSAPYQ